MDVTLLQFEIRAPLIGFPPNGKRPITLMTAEQIFDKIRALPAAERKRLADGLRQLGADELPQDFLDALDDFRNERFVSMETALNEVPPDA